MQKFSKSERLRSKVLIETIFSKGHSFYTHPFNVIWIPVRNEPDQLAQVLISIPRKNFKSAVKRNLLRRRIREIYRRNKPDFIRQLGQLNMKCAFALIYKGRDVMPSSEMEPKIIIILQRLIQENVKVIG